MAEIYISSTFKDLQKEREAAACAVRRLGHSTVAMEDYVASDQRPLSKCLKDVRRSYVYVGLFARRYGFIPQGCDKSITHLEYEEAVKARIPCLIFLLDKDAKWPDEYTDRGEEREKLNRLRGELENKHTVSHFSNFEELCSKVTAAIALEPTLKGLQKNARGTLISKMCDRFEQVRVFWEFFESQSKTAPRRPQFYFIHGDELSGHESFLERLMKTCLKEYVEGKWGIENATICKEEVPWPRNGNLTQQKQQLGFNLLNAFNKWGTSTDYSAAALSRLACLEKRPLVMIKHTLFSSNWEKHTVPLIIWYLENYWSSLDYGHDIPHFLVFFNITYQKSNENITRRLLSGWKQYSKARIRKELNKVVDTAGESSPCLMLDELPEAKMEDVLLWFAQFNIYDDETKRREKAEAIFRETSNKAAKSKSMAKVEKELMKIVEKCQSEVL